MGTRKNNQKSYLLDSKGKLDPGAVRAYIHMLTHPDYFSENIIFALIVIFVLAVVGWGIVFFLGFTALYLIIGFLFACWVIVRV